MRLLALAVFALSSACTHTTEIRSDPPGAEVLVDGARVGVTPMQYEDPPGSARIHEVEVRGAAGTQRFAMKKEGWSIPTIATGAAIGCGSLLAIGAASLGCLFASALGAGVTGGLSLCLLPLGVVGWFVAIGGNVVNLLAVPAVAFLLGRTTPDVVLVDFTKGTVGGEPSQLIVPSLQPAPSETPPPGPSEVSTTALRY